jgi:uncharacterized surface protein with fasciclin (FAS1) repeats
MNSRTFALLAVSAALAAGCQQSDEANQATTANAASTKGAAVEIPNTTIAQTLAGSADHSTLVGAIKAAGLEATMAGSQPYTVFAPTNAAFAKLPQGTLDGLMQPGSKGQLAALLTNHIVPGVVTADDLAKAIEKGGGKTELATVGGGVLSVGRSGDALVITDGGGGQARITRADMLQSNGVVHVTDGVLAPAGG